MAFPGLCQASPRSLEVRSELKINPEDLVKCDLQGFTTAASMLASGEMQRQTHINLEKNTDNI